MPRSQPARPPATPLSDGVVTLRARRASDADAVVAASHDPETQRWLEDDPLPPLADDAARQAALERAEDAWRTGRAAPLIVADAVTDEPVGLVNLQFRDDRIATIAYSVFPAHRGRGVAPRAVELVTPWARADLGVEELLLEADAGNLASIRVAEKCGFTPVDEVLSTDADGRERRTKVFRRTWAADPES
jgi:RimJ/RimL family protein N-acetyltransferase